MFIFHVQMSVNVNDRSYRKIDVDALDPDQYREVAEPTEQIFGNGSGPGAEKIKQLLQSNRLKEALSAALENPPLMSEDQSAKNAAGGIVLKVLTSFKTSEIEAAVKSLSTNQQILLLKYIYKGMQLLTDSQTSQLLCAWHAQVSTIGGPGLINQVLASRRRL